MSNQQPQEAEITVRYVGSGARVLLRRAFVVVDITERAVLGGITRHDDTVFTGRTEPDGYELRIAGRIYEPPVITIPESEWAHDGNGTLAPKP